MGARSKKKLVVPELFPEQRDAADSGHAKVSESIVVKAFGVDFSQVHGLPYNGINLVFVVGVIAAKDDAISLSVALRGSIAIMNQSVRVHIKYPAPHFFCCFNVGIVPTSLVTIEQKHAVIVLVVASKRLLSDP